MSDDHNKSLGPSIEPAEELICILKNNDVDAQVIKEFLDRYQGTGYFGEIQSVLDVKELLEAGLIT